MFHWSGRARTLTDASHLYEVFPQALPVRANTSGGVILLLAFRYAPTYVQATAALAASFSLATRKLLFGQHLGTGSSRAYTVASRVIA